MPGEVIEQRKQARVARLGMAASIATAFGASICCIGPIIAVMFGMTSLAALAKIAAAVADALSYKVTVAGSTAVASKPKIAASSCDVPVVMPSSTKPIALGAYRAQQLRDEFNRASDQVRVVALLSPTCGIC